MAKQIHPSPTAVSYATALLELANERKQTEQIGEDLSGLRQLLTDNPMFGAYLADPSIGDTERSATLKRIFEGKIAPLLEHFMEVLAAKGKLGHLREIADAFDDLLDEQLGKIEVDVTVAQKLTPEQLEEVRQKVSAALKKDAIVHQYVDESIIGGLVLRVQDQLIDASVKTQIANLREQMLAAREK
ncbi:MAG TPA: ATP synthase F1 subunit delta [Tepidisphaeraceae bacterium]|jgi:F-type H+-transporting ATPase subunit delta|nr:ATP synthase F1 subunit delta [Tepidisphaeraceae bacterium]